MPKRIQRKRTKGWRMPEGAVYVGRPTRWGNPFIIDGTGVFSRDTDDWWTATDARQCAVDMFALHTGPLGLYEYNDDTLVDLRRELAGKDLACWCALDQPCHADVLLRIANEEPA